LQRFENPIVERPLPSCDLRVGFEQLLGRIDEAEAALEICARELFHAAGDDGEEGESLDDAMCILHALRNSLKRRPSAIQSTSDFDYPRIA
jgi:hypothetical protein